MTSSPTHDHESSVWRWYKGQVWLAGDRWTFYLEQKTNKQNNYYNNNNKSTPSKLTSQASKLIKYVTRLLHLKKEKKKERTILGVSSKKKKKEIKCGSIWKRVPSFTPSQQHVVYPASDGEECCRPHEGSNLSITNGFMSVENMD